MEAWRIRQGGKPGLCWEDQGHSVLNVHVWLDATKNRSDHPGLQGEQSRHQPRLLSEGLRIEVSGCPHLLLDGEHPRTTGARICLLSTAASLDTVLQRADPRRLQRAIKAPEDLWGPSAHLLLPQSNTRHDQGQLLVPSCSLPVRSYRWIRVRTNRQKKNQPAALPKAHTYSHSDLYSNLPLCFYSHCPVTDGQAKEHSSGERVACFHGNLQRSWAARCAWVD